MPEPVAPHHAENLFFVYGTLRHKAANDITLLQPAPRFIGPACIRGTMVHMGRYPGVTLAGDSHKAGETAGDIVGEVYAVSPALEAVLDTIEAQYPQDPDEYVKRSITVDVHGTSLQCFVYEMNLRFTYGKPVIASGDWVAASS